MKYLLNLSSRQPWLILLSLIICTAVFSTKLSDLKVQISAESMAVEDDPAWIAQQKNLSEFGNSDITVVLFQDKQLFTTEKLTLIKAAIDELSDLTDVEQITSLFSVANIQIKDDNVSTDPFLQSIPQNSEQLKKLLHQAALNPLVEGNLINSEGSAFAINLTFKDIKNPEFDSEISHAIDNILQNYRAQFNSITQIGSPFIRDAITQKISEDQVSIMPWSVAILVLALAIGIRSISGAFIPVFTAGISIIWTLAGMALMDIPISVMTSIVPALLIIIGSTEDIHIIAEYKSALASGLDSQSALDKMSNTIGIAIVLTFVTTYFGFISIYSNEIKMLQEFGLVASSGLLINFIVTSLSVPAILKITAGSKKNISTKKAQKVTIYEKLALYIFDLTLRNTKTTITLLIIITIISIYSAFSLKVNNNPLGYFKPDTDVVKNSHQIHDALSGIQTFSIILNTGVEDTFKKIRYLEEIDKIQQYLIKSNLFDKSLSFSDFIKVIHLVMEEDEVEKIENLYLPDSDILINDYLLFIKHDLVSSYVNKDYSSSRILVRHEISDSSELKKAIDELTIFIQKEIDPALKFTITGSSIVSANAADYMAAGQTKSLVLMSLVIITVVALLFVNWKAGAVALIPNLFPIVVLFAVMGYFGIALDTGTAMVAVIALGICVDDTVHFMTRYHHNTRNHDDPASALRKTVQDESIPIITTSIALMAGFSTFALSSFVPIIHFGLLSAMVMLLAMITTFIITPLLLSFMSLITMWDMLSLTLQAKVINDCPLFKDMSLWSIKQAILMSDVKYYPEGETIISQGSIGDEMYVILEGEVTVQLVRDNCSMVTVNEISAGGLFGEIALVSKVPRTANVIAKTNSSLLTLKLDSINK
ncbi:MAG: MMPL family transporter, partial [Gammaproteobacteria bacterium]|nr:MMPL family transporter [Gammaproteobacteria bacterium]